MSKIGKALGNFAVAIGVFIIGVIGGMGALLLLFNRRTPSKSKEDIEAKLREKSPDDIIDGLDNADAVRAIITGHGVNPDDNPAAGDATLPDAGVWGRDNLFHRGRVDNTKPPTVGG